MAHGHQKKKTSGRTARATPRRTGQKGRRQKRPVAAQARTEFRRGNPRSVRDEQESNRNRDAQVIKQSLERFRDTYAPGGESAQHGPGQSPVNFGQVFQSGTIVVSATRSILQELVNLMQERMHQNFTRLLAFAFCRTPSQVITAQRDFIQDNVEGFVRSAGRIAEVSVQMGREGVRRMSPVSLLPR